MEPFKFFSATFLQSLAPLRGDCFGFNSQNSSVRAPKAIIDGILQVGSLEPEVVSTSTVVEFQCGKEIPGGSSDYECPFLSRRAANSRQGDFRTHGRTLSCKPLGVK